MITLEASAGKRLDQCVAEQMPEISRAFIQKLCDQEKITVNGNVQKAGYKLREDDQITVDYDASDMVIPDIDIPVLYEDDDCIVMNKPAGLLTHALGKHGNEPSVASFLRARVKGLDGDRAGVVHRLDRATSGVIIGAKNQTALSWLQKQFSERKTKKTYMAVIEGHLKQPEAIIDMPIERNPQAPSTFRVGPNGKVAKTHYIVKQEGPRHSLVELHPETGRTHQLRVHLAKIGHPIVGDPLYGSGDFGDPLFLYAQSLEITLPNKQKKEFTAPLPAAFLHEVDAP